MQKASDGTAVQIVTVSPSANRVPVGGSVSTTVSTTSQARIGRCSTCRPRSVRSGCAPRRRRTRTVTGPGRRRGRARARRVPPRQRRSAPPPRRRPRRPPATARRGRAHDRVAGWRRDRVAGEPDQLAGRRPVGTPRSARAATSVAATASTSRSSAAAISCGVRSAWNASTATARRSGSIAASRRRTTRPGSSPTGSRADSGAVARPVRRGRPGRGRPSARSVRPRSAGRRGRSRGAADLGGTEQHGGADQRRPARRDVLLEVHARSRPSVHGTTVGGSRTVRQRSKSELDSLMSTSVFGWCASPLLAGLGFSAGFRRLGSGSSSASAVSRRLVRRSGSGAPALAAARARRRWRAAVAAWLSAAPG